MQKKHYDQHMHSSFSFDGEQGNTIARIIETAIGKGLAGVAVTDHLDPLWPDDVFPSVIDLPAYEAALTEAALNEAALTEAALTEAALNEAALSEAALTEAESMYSGRFHFAKGVELGLMPGEALDICRRAVRGYPYDFVIGSVHSTPEAPFDFPLFLEGRELRDIIEDYYTFYLKCLRLYKDYDVIGHINYIDRYTGSLAPESLFLPYVDDILRLAVQDGKGIEVNTSPLRYGPGARHMPPQSVLNRFKELGGEIVTIGSDAHTGADIGAGIEKGEEMLLAAGFRYVAVFSGRRPDFIRI